MINKRAKNQNNDPKIHWVGMPEFIQVKQEPFAKIIFRFENESDLAEFSTLINQKLTSKTKSAWHPHKPHRSKFIERYVNET